MLAAVVGFLPAVAVFVAAFLRFEARLSIPLSLGLAALAVAGLAGLATALTIRFPAGVLGAWWPF